MGGTTSVPAVPNVTGWVSEFKEFDQLRNRIVNTYKSLHQLGKGSNGTVYKVEHSTTRATYALKCVPISGDVDNARREAEIMIRVTHKSIARVHSAFELLDAKSKDVIAYCIVMDYVEGSNLREYLQRLVPIPKNLVMGCFIKLTQALNYLHQLHIYHFNLKPENIVITKNGNDVNVTIMDFGAAVHHVSGVLISDHSIVGTAAYMAPEMISSKVPPSGSKADIWALGCILYEIWTLDSSFLTEDFGMATKLTKDRELINRLEDFSIVQLLANLLNPDPNLRISAEKLISSPLFKGWQVAIDEGHAERANCPSSALFLFPFISVLSCCLPSPNLCRSNLEYISRWLRIKDFHRVFVEFGCSLGIIKFISLTTESEFITQALNVLNMVLSFEHGTALAYQICANPIGIPTLLKQKGMNEILKLLQFSFGHATLKRCFAIDDLVYTFLLSNDNVKLGRGLYEDLPETTVPFSLYFINAIFSQTSEKISCIADCLSNHKDMPELLREPGVYDKLEKLLCDCLNHKDKNIPKLLNGVSTNMSH